MIRCLVKDRGISRMTACLATLLLNMAVLSFGGTQVGRITNSDSEQDRLLSEIAAKLKGKKRVRVLTAGGKIILHQPTILPEGISFNTETGGSGSSGTISWDEVLKLQVRRNGAGKGALIGGSIGAGLGLLLGLASMRECSGWMDFFCDADFGDVMLFTAISGAAGALQGALVGALTGRWGTIYSHPGGIKNLPLVSIMPAPRGGFVLSIRLAL
jgi:hypothetical protein